ncbi:hypothetical protein WMY93_029761 [Mugilogobius chulae]|uniref:C2H2-type domain-containing protein n=1 Tax=Mugilogobius chulae TaxID=88201 RepID=A0AAW0MVX0_9GOBI
MRIIFLCCCCGATAKSIPSLAGHVSKCGKSKNLMSLGGSCLCSECGKPFATPRGLSQHDMFSRGCGGTESLEFIRERLGHPLPPPSPVEGVQANLLGALGWGAAPSKVEIRLATKLMVKGLQRKFRLSSARKGSVGHYSKVETFRSNYATCQHLWKQSRKDLVNLVFLGGLLVCKILKE